jgi:hypothetical protein
LKINFKQKQKDGYKLCTDLMQMISERADIEKAYAKNLKTWSKKWSDCLQKTSTEYGTMKQTYNSALQEADKLADIHLSTHSSLIDELNKEIKEWQKQSYPKSIVNALKTPKEYDEEFKKAQKPWGKKYALVEKLKKDYHTVGKSMHLIRTQLQQQNDQQQPPQSQLSADARKKLEDKLEKYKKELEQTKNKYKQALEDLNSYNSRYIEDMKTVYAKCDQFEKDRLEFFIQKFLKLHTHLNIYEKANVDDIYTEFLRTIRDTNSDKDLTLWSKEYGCGMNMNWPLFEEYSPLDESSNNPNHQNKQQLAAKSGTAVRASSKFVKEDSLQTTTTHALSTNDVLQQQQQQHHINATNNDFDSNNNRLVLLFAY